MLVFAVYLMVKSFIVKFSLISSLLNGSGIKDDFLDVIDTDEDFDEGPVEGIYQEVHL